MACFNIDPTQETTAFIYDQDNLEISIDIFPIVIRQLLNPAVFIRIVFNGTNVTSFDLVGVKFEFNLHPILTHRSTSS